MITSLRRQSGIAIITAVAVAALVAALAGAMAFRHSLWLRQVENQQDLTQARGVARAAVDLSRLTLRADVRQNVYDHPRESWAIPIPSLPVEQGSAGGAISDVQGRYNLNNLIREGVVSEADLRAFKQLLESAGLATDLANAVLDWMDADAETRYPGGAEDREYLAETPPRRAANRQFFDLDELRQVRGFTPAIVEQLRPYVMAMPRITKVNVNFATPEVLSALLPGLDVSTASTILREHASNPFQTIDAFKEALPTAARSETVPGVVDVRSDYFFADVDARFGRVTVAYRTLLERNGDEVPRVVWMRRR